MGQLKGYAVFDLETTVKKSYKRTANPFDPDNFIVAAGWKHQGGDIGYVYDNTGVKCDWFINMLNKNPQLVVGQNIKFDILHAISKSEANRAAWFAYVARGGNLWDTQLAEFALNGMLPEEQMLSMDELAPRYGGTVKIDEVKKLWQAGVDTPNIPKDLLIDYLTGRTNADGSRDMGDIDNTEIIFLGQLARARAAKQVQSLLLNMGSMLFTTEAERNGMAVDSAYAHGLAVELGARLEKLEASLQEYLPTGLPFEFNWTNRYHLSPLIFGGQVKYKQYVPEMDSEGKQVYVQKVEKHYVLTDGSTMEPDQWHELYPQDKARDVARFAGGKNKGEVKTKNVKVDDLTKPKGAQREFFYRFPRITEPDAKWASSTPGLYSVAGEIIESLGNRDIPFLKHLSEVSSLSKDLKTYYISTDPKTGEQKGMLTLVQPDGIIHHRINHTNTVTLRFSSSDPNLQNIPRKDKSVVKTVFVSRYADPDKLTLSRSTADVVDVGGKICQSDFTSLEVYVQAILTLCKQLIADLRLGLDMHCLRVSQTFSLDYKFVVEQVKAGDKDMKLKRTNAKEFSFQRAYGAGAQKISESTGIPYDIVMKLIEAEEARYPEIVKYFDDRARGVERSRIDIGRVVPHPDIKGAMCHLGRGYGRTPDRKLYSYHESPSPEFLAKRGKLQSFSPTEIKNYEVQGGGGEWSKAAMWLAVRAFYAKANYNGRAVLVNQVHDALYGDFADEVAHDASALLHACMLEASTFMEYYFQWEVPVPVPSETMLGNNMMEENSPESPEWLQLTYTYRRHLRDTYMGGYNPSFDTLTGA